MMSPDLIILMTLIPLTAGVVTLLLTGRVRMQRDIGLVMVVLNCAVCAWGLFSVYRGPDADANILAMNVGAWPTPFGIGLVLDPLSALMLTVSSIVSGAVFVYCIGQLPPFLRGGFFHPLFHFLILGVQWSFLTGDLFNLFVAFEIMLMSSYILLVSGTSPQQMRQGYKYVLLNLLASMMFVTCAGLIYGETGTLNMADLTRMSQNGTLPSGAVPIFALLLLVFGVKAAIFPIWFWLPDTYYTMHSAIGGLFGGLLTKVGAYVMVRIFAMTVGQPEGAVAQTVAPLILISAGATMFIGVLGAVSMNSIRRILSIHIISQVGYMILGVGLGIVAGTSVEFRELAIAGAVFFIIHNMVVKTALFLCGGLMCQHAGDDDLTRIGGLVRRAPWLATMFLIAALSLAGLPPLSGFFGKFLLIRQSFDAGYHVLAGLAIATSLLTLLSMLKIWSYGFWSAPQGRHLTHAGRGPRVKWGMFATAVLVVMALSMGLFAQSYYNISRAAARVVVSPRTYIDTVLPPLDPSVAASSNAAGAEVVP